MSSIKILVRRPVVGSITTAAVYKSHEERKGNQISLIIN